MGKDSRSKYKHEFAIKNYDRSSILFPKGQRDVLKRAAEMAGKSLNAFMLDTARAEAGKILEKEIEVIRGYAITEESSPINASNIVLYIDSTDSAEFTDEPLRIAILNFDTGAILYRGEYKTIFSSEGDSINGAVSPSKDDISTLKGYLGCENIITYSIERMGCLSEGWHLDIDHSRITSLNGESSGIMDMLGYEAGTKERDVRPYELAKRLCEYAKLHL